MYFADGRIDALQALAEHQKLSSHIEFIKSEPLTLGNFTSCSTDEIGEIHCKLSADRPDEEN